MNDPLSSGTHSLTTASVDGSLGGHAGYGQDGSETSWGVQTGVTALDDPLFGYFPGDTGSTPSPTYAYGYDGQHTPVSEGFQDYAGGYGQSQGQYTGFTGDFGTGYAPAPDETPGYGTYLGYPAEQDLGYGAHDGVDPHRAAYDTDAYYSIDGYPTTGYAADPLLADPHTTGAYPTAGYDPLGQETAHGYGLGDVQPADTGYGSVDHGHQGYPAETFGGNAGYQDLGHGYTGDLTASVQAPYPYPDPLQYGERYDEQYVNPGQVPQGGDGFADYGYPAPEAAATPGWDEHPVHADPGTGEFPAHADLPPVDEPEPHADPADEPGPEPEPSGGAGRDHQHGHGRRSTTGLPVSTGRNRRRRARRSALLTVAVPSICVVGVAGVAAATVVTTGDDGGGSATEAKDAPPTTPAAKAPTSKLDTQLTSLSAGAEDFADRASRTQKRIDLKVRQEEERKRKEAEARRREALRPKFALPVSAHGLSASYGQSGINWMSLHTGIDFPVDLNTSVMAATDGTVRTQWNPAYGNMAIVTAADGTETWYCHLNSTRIRSGSVKAGDVIAYSGSTGKSTGPHLHFEVRPYGGSPIDPLQWLLSKGLDPR